ncbi:hypothetical protein N9X18_01880 [Gammaproteobacteria bacterium]|nr:hypothetical protein [Gammaproteobacteria bacterium]
MAWQGCNSEAKTITKVIERPVPTIKYVNRWRTDTVRFVSKKVITQRDTIYQDRIVNRLDTLFVVDTISIVEAWLTEVAKYDTTVNDIRLTWSNYQNRTENLKVELRKKPLGWALGVHGLVGLESDFVENYKPLFGVGLQATIKRTYFSVNYGYNTQHFIGVGVGRNLISK